MALRQAQGERFRLLPFDHYPSWSLGSSSGKAANDPIADIEDEVHQLLVIILSDLWPMGLCQDLAMIDEQAVDRLSLRFFRESDDLDSFEYVVLETLAGLYALRLYDYQPVPGYVLIGMENAQPPEEQIRAFLVATGLNAADLTWRVSAYPNDR